MFVKAAHQKLAICCESCIGTYKISQMRKEINLLLPKSLAEAYKISNSENPNLQISFLEFGQAKLDVTIAGSELSPSTTLSYKVAKQRDISSTVQERTQETITATATWPLFTGGSNTFNYRKFKEIKNQKQLLLKTKKKL